MNYEVIHCSIGGNANFSLKTLVLIAVKANVKGQMRVINTATYAAILGLSTPYTFVDLRSARPESASPIKQEHIIMRVIPI